MLRALLLLACTAKVAAFAQTPAGEAGCVDMDPDVIQSAFAEAIQDVEVEGVPTITSCADVAANGGCADEEVAASCCATCALPQRMTYSYSWNSPIQAFIRCTMIRIRCLPLYGVECCSCSLARGAAYVTSCPRCQRCPNCSGCDYDAVNFAIKTECEARCSPDGDCCEWVGHRRGGCRRPRPYGTDCPY